MDYTKVVDMFCLMLKVSMEPEARARLEDLFKEYALTGYHRGRKELQPYKKACQRYELALAQAQITDKDTPGLLQIKDELMEDLKLVDD